MPRIKYVDYKPTAAVREVIEAAVYILEEYSANGFDLTLRQLYYQFIARDLFPESYAHPTSGTKNTIQSYNKLKSIVASAREAGLIDWSHIVDRGRSSESRPHWDDATNFMSSVAPQFNIDIWEAQPRRVEVWVEKDALSDVVSRACVPLDVPFTACKGYMSASTMWDAAHNRMLVNWNERRQPTVVLHLGDHDPSGIDMTRDIQKRLNLFSSQTSSRHSEERGHPEITVSRIALTREQIEQYNPPPNPAKESDARYPTYQADHGDESWELDALEPQVIIDLITEDIRNLMAPRIYQRSRRTEASQRAQLEKIATNWDAVSDFLTDLPDEPEPSDDE